VPGSCGYTLARPADKILLSEILSAADGPISLGDFGEPHRNGACDHEGQCVLLAIWHSVGEHMRDHLAQFTLGSVLAAARGETTWPDESTRKKKRR
jgi:Rrf2 family iron-sulfur cluster assembly transcriptional regulator